MVDMTSITTKRLAFTNITEEDALFMLELVNTDGWLKFIGDRNVHSEQEAISYIKKILDNKSINYWVIRIKETGIPIGVLSFNKRDFLDFFDLGFSLLPSFKSKGYAYEAANALINELPLKHFESTIVALTNPDNEVSINLLKKLGFQLDKQIVQDRKHSNVFKADTNKLAIDSLAKMFFSVFCNKNGNNPDWEILKNICIPEILVINKTKAAESIYNLDSFISPRKKLLSDGTLIDFEEFEISEETFLFNSIAQRKSIYEKSGILSGKQFKAQGTKLTQFLKTNSGWKISSVIWEDE